ncbi:MAG TPA: tetratricopeptide repeat protein [Candidatus Binataceae bacterium]
MRIVRRTISIAIATRGLVMMLASLVLLSGCLQSAIDENKQQIDQQQKQIDSLQQQLNALSVPQYTPAPGSGCDKEVMATATRRGGDRFAAGDVGRALGYYQDALTACPGNPQAEVNLARTYEAMGNRAAATQHYQNAANSSDPSQKSAEDEARAALAHGSVAK